jgi:Holliday junction resolvase
VSKKTGQIFWRNVFEKLEKHGKNLVRVGVHF